MLKGLGEPEMTISVIMFVGGILIATGIIATNFIQVSAALKGTEDQAHIVNYIRMAVSCFSDKAGVMDPEKLTQASKSACDLEDIKICVKDVLADKEWLDCKNMDDSKPVTKSYAALKSVSDIHMGEVSVQKT